MTNAEILTVLKTDLQIAVNTQDTFLTSLIEQATAAVTTEGMTVHDTVQDGMIVEQYAAFLWRKRREDTVAMPRYLRWMLNNRIMAEKMGHDFS